MATRRQKRKRRRRGPGAGPSSPQPPPGGEAQPPPDGEARAASGTRARDGRAGRPRPGGGPPPPPWGSFPLSEIVVLVAIVLLVAGFLSGPPRGAALLGTGLVLGSLAGLELAAREHFAGYRSHSLLLAGAAAVLVAVALFALADLPAVACLAVAAAVLGGGAYLLARSFRRSSGGSLFKVRP